ncbi:MFS transporter [Arthrobacter tecti]
MSVISELRMRPAPVQSRRWNASVSARLVLAVVVIATLLVGANLATPLYPLIRSNLGLSAFDTTAAFAAYVFVLVAGLLLVGHWSDHIGRRAALVLAVGTGVVGAVVFGAATSLPMLILGRCLQGAAVACATGASAAALRDLLPHRPEWASRFTLVASAGGVAAGPMIGGLLSLLPEPTRLPFGIYAIFLLLLLIPLVLLDARPAINAPAGRPLSALKPRRPTVSREAARAFWIAAAIGFLSFSLFGFALSLAPTYFAQIADDAGRPVIGLLAGLVLAVSAVSQLFPLRVRHSAPIGLAAMTLGAALIPVAGATGSVLLLVAACIVAGAGQGTAFRTVFNEVALKVEAAQHAQIISTVYVITYLGSAVPVLGLGLAVDVVGLSAAVSLFAGVIALASAGMAVLVWRAGRA